MAKRAGWRNGAVSVLAVMGLWATAEAGVFTVSDDATLNNDLSQMDAGSGIGVIDTVPQVSFTINLADPPISGIAFRSPTGTLTVDLTATTQPNTLVMNALDNLFNTPNVFLGGSAQNDLFDINSITGHGLYTVDGRAGNNTLDVSGLSGTLINTGTSIFQNGVEVIAYRNINTVVGVSAPVPEPTTGLLLATGLVGLIAYARRRRQWVA